jgi:hypothetical protein
MSLVDAHLLAASGSDSGAAAAWEPGLLVCIGRLLNVLISSLGPEVSRDPDRIRQVRHAIILSQLFDAIHDTDVGRVGAVAGQSRLPSQARMSAGGKSFHV